MGESETRATPEQHHDDVDQAGLESARSSGGYLITHPDLTTETVDSLKAEQDARRRWNEQNRGH
jgi:hypothetical protein